MAIVSPVGLAILLWEWISNFKWK